MQTEADINPVWIIPRTEFLRSQAAAEIFDSLSSSAVGIICTIFCPVCIQSDVDSSQPKAVPKPGTDTGSQQSAATPAQETKSSAAMGGPDAPGEEPSTGGKKVVRVVRRVVRRVVPAATEDQNQHTGSEAAKGPAVPDSVLKTATVAKEDKDAISMGLASLMGRSRTKEHRPRTRTQDRKEDVEEVTQEEEKAKVEEAEEKPDEMPTAVPAAASPSPAPLKSNPLTPPAGFIPVPKSDPWAPPAGFIPAPKHNPLTPPAGFIPARKSSPVPPKQNLLARPPGFIPVTKTDPLAPPAGFIPKPRLVAVKKQEVLCERSACFLLDLWMVGV